jgi:hypothetical protein
MHPLRFVDELNHCLERCERLDRLASQSGRRTVGESAALSVARQIQTLMSDDQGEDLVPQFLVALKLPSRRLSVLIDDLDRVAFAITKHETVGLKMISFRDPSDLRPIYGADAQVSKRTARRNRGEVHVVGVSDRGWFLSGSDTPGESGQSVAGGLGSCIRRVTASAVRWRPGTDELPRQGGPHRALRRRDPPHWTRQRTKKPVDNSGRAVRPSLGRPPAPDFHPD